MGTQQANIPPEPVEPAEAKAPKATYQAEPGLTARERWKKAINLLQIGESGQARAELVAYLKDKPGSGRARDLIKQIDSDPVAYLGEKYFLYRLERGDSLSIVAKRMLGDPLKFHVLARYNDIENPSKTVAGQMIKVPGDKPPPKPAVETEEQTAETEALDEEPAEEVEEAVAEPAEAKESADGGTGAAETGEAEAGGTSEVAKAVEGETQTIDDGAAQLEQLMEQAVAKVQEGDYAGASNAYEEAMARYPDDTFLKQMAALNYLTYADTLQIGGDREKASLILVRAQQLDPENEEIRQRLGYYAKLDEADAYYQEGTGHQADGDLIAAYASYQKAVSVVPDHNLANKKLLSLTPAVAEAYYRKGLKAFRRHDLDEAIAMYDRCLSVDPGFSSCSVKRIETVELKENLEGIKD